MAWALRGYENLLTDFVTDADTVESVLDIPFRWQANTVRMVLARA
jgi:hypothetical protein